MPPLPPLLYGATGYTGRLIARAASERGTRLILAGRDARRVPQLAHELGLDHRVFALDDPIAVARGLAGVSVVLNCAGPFGATWSPIVQACLAGGVHYLDITGEVDVFEGVAALDDVALEAGVTLLPGVGFDVVATDCLAAHLKHRLPEAIRLLLGILSTGRLSRGTASTMIEHMDRDGMVRRDGRITPVPLGSNTRAIDFGRGPRLAVAIPWGDVSTAGHSTGIPDVEVFAKVGSGGRTALRAARALRGLLRSRTVKGALQWIVRSGPIGPDDEELAKGTSVIWGRAEDAGGNAVEGRMVGPNPYRFTVDSACLILARVLRGEVPPGFQTPSLAFGPDLVLELPDVEREDLWGAAPNVRG